MYRFVTFHHSTKKTFTNMRVRNFGVKGVETKKKIDKISFIRILKLKTKNFKKNL